jgi:hypothetical protein
MLPTSRSSYKWSPWTNIDRWSEPRTMGHPLPPSPSSRGSSAFISYTRVLERRLKVVPAGILPVQRIGRRILPPHPRMGPVDQNRRIPSWCE